MMQKTCLDCYRKHIAKANVLENEYNLGYPLHKYLVIGELACAEDEVLEQFPKLAEKTRECRNEFYMDDIPVPTMELLKLSVELERSENAG